MKPQRSAAFDRIIADYLQQIADLDYDRIAGRLAIGVRGRDAVIPVFGLDYRVTAQGVLGPDDRPASHAVSVTLFKYLLMCPDREPTGADWVTYKDFKDAAPFVGGFLNTAERPIAEAFAGRRNDLEDACRKLGGHPATLGVSADVAMQFVALPRIPMVLLFNDRDEEFPAACTMLFESRARHFLDMECLAMTGMVLARRLIQPAATPSPRETDPELL